LILDRIERMPARPPLFFLTTSVDLG